MDEGKLQQARAAYDKAIAARSTTLDCFYRRGVCALLLGDAAAALPDLEMTVGQDAGHDFYRAVGLLADAYAKTGQDGESRRDVPPGHRSLTLSETYLNYADFLASQGRNGEARQWAQKVLDKKPHHAAIPAPPRAFVVSPRQSAVEARCQPEDTGLKSRF